MSEAAPSRRSILIGLTAVAIAPALPEISVAAPEPEWVPPWITSWETASGVGLNRLAHIWGLVRKQTLAAIQNKPGVTILDWVEPDDELRRRLVAKILEIERLSS